MRIIRGYKTELDPNDRQRTACAQHAGAARYAYNWGLQRKIEAYEATGKSPTAIDLHRELNALKKTELAWMVEVSKCAPQEALRNLDRAFAHFFRRVRWKQQGKLHGPVGFPRFKSRKAGLGSFRLRWRAPIPCRSSLCQTLPPPGNRAIGTGRSPRCPSRPTPPAVQPQCGQSLVMRGYRWER